MNIDLHIHSNHSDGTYSLDELLSMIRNLDIKLISITDHDTVSAYDELKKKNLDGLRVVQAVELSSVYDAEPRDILGYGIDIEKMRKLLKEKESPERDWEKEEILLDRYIESFRRNGMIIDEGLEIKKGFKNEAYETVMANANTHPENIEKYPLITNWSAFFWSNPSVKESPFYVDNTFFETGIEECIRMIHEADGLAFFAHPCIHGKTHEHVEGMLNEAMDFGIDGIEVLHAKHSAEDREFLSDFADRHGLFKSGGSDFHGFPKPDIKLLVGRGDLDIRYSMIEDWIEDVRYFG